MSFLFNRCFKGGNFYKKILRTCTSHVVFKEMFSRISRLETMPVFRHGSEAARICDEALSVSGPTDPRIAKIIQTDQNAQMAYHIHKALGFALEVKTTVIEY